MLGFDALAKLPVAAEADQGIIASVTGVSATTAVGSAIIITNSVIPVTGVSATGTAGNVFVKCGVTVDVTGVQATGYVNDNLLIWSLIDTNQTPDWTGISDGQTPNWTPVNDSDSVTWTQIAA
jgi:hypothetical protein